MSTSSEHVTITKLDAATEDQRIGQSLTALALRRLRRDKLTIVAICFIVILTFVSLFASFIEDHILHVDYTRTNITDVFLPPGTEGHI